MKKLSLVFTLSFLLVGCGSTDNFAGCIVENMRGVQNEPSRAAVNRMCLSTYPDKYNQLKVGVGNSMLNSTTKDECIAKNNKNIILRNASSNLIYACHCLYDEPEYKGETCRSEAERFLDGEIPVDKLKKPWEYNYNSR